MRRTLWRANRQGDVCPVGKDAGQGQHPTAVHQKNSHKGPREPPHYVTPNGPAVTPRDPCPLPITITPPRHSTCIAYQFRMLFLMVCLDTRQIGSCKNWIPTWFFHRIHRSIKIIVRYLFPRECVSLVGPWAPVQPPAFQGCPSEFSPVLAGNLTP